MRKTMNKVEHAEQSLYRNLVTSYPHPIFVGVGKQISNEIVLVIYVDTSSELNFAVPVSWEGFRVVLRDLCAAVGG